MREYSRPGQNCQRKKSKTVSRVLTTHCLRKLNHALDLTARLGNIAGQITLPMSRPVTLFTGQWADLPLAELAPKVKAMGYDGVELACWGDHFDVDFAFAEPDYIKKKRADR